MKWLENLIRSKFFIIYLFGFISSIFFIWLIPNPLKFFFILYIIPAYFIIKKIYDQKNNESRSVKFHKLDGKFIRNLICIFLPVILIILNFFNFEKVSIFRSIISLFVISFLPGYCLFRSNENLRKSLSNLEFFLFIFIFGYIFTGVCWLIILVSINTIKNRIFSLYLIYLLLSIYNVLKNHGLKDNKINSVQSFATKKDKYGILMILIIYTFSHILIYPDIVYSPLDIARHYAYSLQLGRNFNLYLNRNWGNILAHLYESAFIYSANSSIEIIQITLVSLNYLYPLAFYIAIKRLFRKFDARLPIIATWIYTVGSLGGIGWIYYVKTKISVALGNDLLSNNIANTVYNQTFKSNSYGFLSSYFKPIMISFIIFFFLLALLSNFDLKKKYFILIFSTFLTGMFFVHVVEATILSVFLGIWGFISKSKHLRLSDTLISNVFSLILSIGLFGILSILKNKIPLIYFITLFSSLIFNSFSYMFRRKFLVKFQNSTEFDFLFITKKFGNFINNYIPKTILFLFITALLTWITLWDRHEVSVYYLNKFRQIPWFFQALRLGVIGFIGILYLIKITKKKKYSKEFNFLLFFSIYSFILGRLITFINIFFASNNPIYWETRFEVFIIIPWIIFSVLYSIEIFDFFKRKISKNSTNLKDMKIIELKQFSIVFILFISNFTTVLLNLEVRWGVALPLKELTRENGWEDQIQGINYVSDLLDEDPSAGIITINYSTSGLINLAGPAKLITLSANIVNSNDDNITLNEINKAHYWRNEYVYINLYFYLKKTDFELLQNITNSYLKFYLNNLPIIYQNDQVYVFNETETSTNISNQTSNLIINDQMNGEYKNNLNYLLKNKLKIRNKIDRSFGLFYNELKSIPIAIMWMIIELSCYYIYKYRDRIVKFFNKSIKQKQKNEKEKRSIKEIQK